MGRSTGEIRRHPDATQLDTITRIMTQHCRTGLALGVGPVGNGDSRTGDVGNVGRCHLLWADRFAQLVNGADDVLAALGRLPPGKSPAAAALLTPGADPGHPTDEPDLESARVSTRVPHP